MGEGDLDCNGQGYLKQLMTAFAGVHQMQHGLCGFGLDRGQLNPNQDFQTEDIWAFHVLCCPLIYGWPKEKKMTPAKNEL